MGYRGRVGPKERECAAFGAIGIRLVDIHALWYGPGYTTFALATTPHPAVHVCT